MQAVQHPTTTAHRNWLLRGLPREEHELLAPHLESISLTVGQVICEVNAPVEYVYFPENGVISHLSVMTDGSAVETATIGHEGMSGIAVFHGVDRTPEHAFVQVPGEAERMSAEAFRRVIKQTPVLDALLGRFTVALITLIGQNSGCNRKHSVLRRCARWMLMSHDRVGRDGFELTHHVLSQMLGVRRASVTEAALALSQAGAIEYRRGFVNVLDRQALERASCECYWIIHHAFDRLLGRGTATDPLAGIKLSKGGRSTAKDGTPEEDAGSATG
jgi:CRP-like cAMP-binding protein